MQTVEGDSRILDSRDAKDFKGMSFSGFKIGQVTKKLELALSDRSVEDASFWAAEMICAGHYAKLWETIALTCAERHVIASPRVPILAAAHFESFKKLVQTGYEGQELELRNVESIRSMFAELVAVLCTTKRQHRTPPVKICAETAFDMTVLAGRLEAPNTSFAGAVFGEGDPQELFVAVNELCYQLSESQTNGVAACYWVEWIAAFVKRCSGKGASGPKARARGFAPVPEAFSRDPRWMSWEAIMHYGKTRGPLVSRALEALLTLYCIRYTSGCVRRRMPIVYAAVALATSTPDFSTPVLRNPDAVKNIVARAISSTYREIKKSENATGGGQGHKRPAQTNRQKTSERLQRMDAVLAGAAPQRFQ